MLTNSESLEALLEVVRLEANEAATRALSYLNAGKPEDARSYAAEYAVWLRLVPTLQQYVKNATPYIED